jgi:hypothetical protein
MVHKHHVSFVATKPVNEPAKISFHTRDGRAVSFNGHKEVKEPVKVDFMAKNK